MQEHNEKRSLNPHQTSTLAKVLKHLNLMWDPEQAPQLSMQPQIIATIPVEGG